MRDRSAAHPHVGGTWDDGFAIRECVARMNIRAEAEAVSVDCKNSRRVFKGVSCRLCHGR